MNSNNFYNFDSKSCQKNQQDFYQNSLTAKKNQDEFNQGKDQGFSNFLRSARADLDSPSNFRLNSPMNMDCSQYPLIFTNTNVNGQSDGGLLYKGNPMKFRNGDLRSQSPVAFSREMNNFFAENEFGNYGNNGNNGNNRNLSGERNTPKGKGTEIASSQNAAYMPFIAKNDQIMDYPQIKMHIDSMKTPKNLRKGNSRLDDSLEMMNEDVGRREPIGVSYCFNPYSEKAFNLNNSNNSNNALTQINQKQSTKRKNKQQENEDISMKENFTNLAQNYLNNEKQKDKENFKEPKDLQESRSKSKGKNSNRFRSSDSKFSKSSSSFKMPKNLQDSPRRNKDSFENDSKRSLYLNNLNLYVNQSQSNRSISQPHSRQSSNSNLHNLFNEEMERVLYQNINPQNINYYNVLLGDTEKKTKPAENQKEAENEILEINKSESETVSMQNFPSKGKRNFVVNANYDNFDNFEENEIARDNVNFQKKSTIEIDNLVWNADIGQKDFNFNYDEDQDQDEVYINEKKIKKMKMKER